MAKAQTAVGRGLRDWGTWGGTLKSPGQEKAGLESPKKTKKNIFTVSILCFFHFTKEKL